MKVPRMTWRGLPSGAVGIRERVNLLLATGIFFPLAIMAAAGFFWLRDLDDRILEARLAAVRLAAAHFDSRLSDDLEVLQRLASSVSPSFGDADLGPERKATREAHAQFHHRESVFVLDGERNVLAEEPAGPVSAAPAEDLAVVEEVMRSGRPRLSGLVQGPRGLVVHELVPVRSSWENKVVGLAGGTFDPARRGFERLLAELPRGPNGSAELVDASGTVLASTLPGRTGKRIECAYAPELIAGRQEVTARCDGCHSARGVLTRAPAELVTIAPLASAPWGVLLRQRVAEALPTEGTLPWWGVLATLLVQVGLATAFAWGAARSVTRPVEVLTHEAERIAAGHLQWPIPELGADEVGRLGTSLDRMRENLRQLIARLDEANAQLEARVDDRTRQLNEANARLREREEALESLLRKVISAQEDERKRIARELHDETSQSLAVLAMGIEGAMDAIRGGRTPRLDEVKAVAVRTLEDVHRLILDLRPSVLDDLGLLSAIRWYAERHLESRGISVRCEFGDYVHAFAPEVETALFRICQEAMTNVARHAQATAVLIQVGVEAGELRIEIEDDGKGFDPAEAGRRQGRRPWGLMGIGERAEILGGSARIDSAPGQGTRVLVRVPLPREPEPADDEATSHEEGAAA